MTATTQKVKLTVPAHRVLCKIAAYVRRYRPMSDRALKNAVSEVMSACRFRSSDPGVSDLLAAGIVNRFGGGWLLTDLGTRLLRPITEECG